ncbi:multicopper oxidase domain-containing protein [Labrenzia sp. R4_2]|uniref:multicopper oxidase domain-containing protein n=1 Tax=Labrenzia sp. R4_2 TaxID=2821107 RepID=UPI001ADCE91F|nr:multicopper oxidase domain-containing protein [Labrenzia sp. R4_2]MBO9422990.1 multicopper oxidase domain-containing protein [Labrenzia sp. R4_2]
MINRRNLLVGSAAGALTVGAAAWIGKQPGKTNAATLTGRPRLRYPPLLDASSNRNFGLSAQYGMHDFGSGIGSSTAGFDQPYLGPTVLFKPGETHAQISNALKEDITVHWHGLIVPGDQDGGPHQPISPGGKWSVNLEVDQPPATLWYHSHSHRRTAVQVYHGLAGMMILTDGLDKERGLPNSYGTDDLALVFQDRRFGSDGKLSYDLGMMDLMHGFTGEVATVNGQIDAVATVPRGVARLRLLNGSNARIYELFIDDGRPMHLIATDGGYIPEPIELDSLTLSPGERAEVLIDFSDGNPITIYSRDDPNQGPAGMMGRVRGLYDTLFASSFPILSIPVDDRIPARVTKIPDALDGNSIAQERESGRTRSLTLNMGMRRMMRSGQSELPFFAINNNAYEIDKLNFSVPIGSTERWIIRSEMLSHPFHVHGTRFQVVSENGSDPRPEYAGWKDTVLVSGSVELKMSFDKPARPDKPFMFHCHILEHEDNGMMGQFSVG